MLDRVSRYAMLLDIVEEERLLKGDLTPEVEVSYLLALRSIERGMTWGDRAQLAAILIERAQQVERIAQFADEVERRRFN